MEKKRINKMPKDVYNRICSGQVIVDLSSIVKELIENSIDAKATRIEIRLSQYGQESVEVIDNGYGIHKDDFESVVKKYSTSKIQQFEDIDFVESFGFRGEALSSICEISGKFIITTKHGVINSNSNKAKDDDNAYKLEFEKNGNLKSVTPTARQQGTTVLVINPFETLPVRRVDFVRNIKKHYAKLLSLLQGYAIISSGVKIILSNSEGGKRSVVMATQGGNAGKIDANISNVFGSEFLSKLSPFHFECSASIRPRFNILDKEKKMNSNNNDDGDIENVGISSQSDLSQKDEVEKADNPIEGDGNESKEKKPYSLLNINAVFDGFVSKMGSGSGKDNSEQHQLWYLNGRPVDLKKMTKMVNEVWRQYETKNTNSKPAFILNISLTPGSYDINLSPNKREVFISCEDTIVSELRSKLASIWESSKSTYSTSKTEVVEKPVDSHIAHKTINSAADKMDIEEEEVTMVKEVNEMHELNKSDDDIDDIDDVPETITKKDDPKEKEVEMEAETAKNKRNRSETVDDEKEIDFEIENENDATSKETNQSNQKSSSTMLEASKIISEDTESEIDENVKKVMLQAAESALPKSSKRKRRRVIPFKNMSLTEIKEEMQQQRQRKKESQYVKPSESDVYHSAQLKANEKEETFSESQEERAEEELERVFNKADFANKIKIIGQFNLGFIIARVDDDLFILDQHACDERIRLERLQKTIVIHEQKLIRPLPIELSAVEEEIIRNNLDIFAFNGFKFIEMKPGDDSEYVAAMVNGKEVEEVQENGDDNNDEFVNESNQEEFVEDPLSTANKNRNKKKKIGRAPTFFLTTLPHTFSSQFGVEDVKELISLIRDNPIPPRPSSSSSDGDEVADTSNFPRIPKLASMFASRACRGAVMVGTALTTKEMQQLVGQLSTLNFPWCCAHGRPTMRHLIHLSSSGSE